jgi:hypothetical protein
MIEAWNEFTGTGENSHQWIDTLSSTIGQKLCWWWQKDGSLLGTGGNIRHGTTDQPRPMVPVGGGSLLLLEALAGGPGKRVSRR